MSEQNREKFDVAATCFKRQRRISGDLISKNSNENSKLIHQDNKEAPEEHPDLDESNTYELDGEYLTTPAARPTKASPGSANGPQPTVDPFLVAYFKTIDDEELLVEEEDEDN